VSYTNLGGGLPKAPSELCEPRGCIGELVDWQVGKLANYYIVKFVTGIDPRESVQSV